MEAKASRGFLATIWGLVLIGVVLLTWWAFAVYAYGIEVDEHALAPTTRPGDVALFTPGVLSLTTASLLPILHRKRAQHRA